MLRTDGILLMTVPFCWDEHEQPNDSARYSSFGLQAILQNHGFEMKWTKRKSTPPKEWIETYSNASYEVISRDNYLEFIV